ncbi:PHB depolymerase family esterase [Janthinobacterium fluminis]|uniref:PHB depolymerase family esterase n=1 Tax=Janthinobacterium fluminis TaxID=2987524 RepID=A0ABT5JW82_9BURK|nr:PHB depolymerase family esterase [Janthinobacterium fluminis]MDC8756690.1 PHB depolymerase family esterase [Janthinobacterium fluminis]
MSPIRTLRGILLNLRRHLLPMLFLAVLPLLYWELAHAADVPYHGAPSDAAIRRAHAKGLDFISDQWCLFYPQIASCPGSPFTLPADIRRDAPPGMVAIQSNFCVLIPSLPICPKVVDPSLTEVKNFGTNPGALKMFKYVPQNLGASRPLVVALHGCTQSASAYNDETGWIQLADKFHFALLLPQETVHQNNCFRWFEPNHSERGKGEALSIRQMIEKMTDDLNIDARRVYVSGLSAGGAMTAVMLATYPEVFAGGGIVAGIPFRCASNQNEALPCGVKLSLSPGKMATEKKNMSPKQWGDLVRHASNFTGPYPPVSIWHGSADDVVDPQDEIELMEQWTDLLGTGQTPAKEEVLQGNNARLIHHQIFSNSSGHPMVETFLIDNMKHAVPVNPGGSDAQCGKEVQPYVINAGICSSLAIANFLGIDKQ